MRQMFSREELEKLLFQIEAEDPQVLEDECLVAYAMGLQRAIELIEKMMRKTL